MKLYSNVLDLWHALEFRSKFSSFDLPFLITIVFLVWGAAGVFS